MKTIEIKCRGADLISLDVLTEFQGELKDLSKENYEKLKGLILTLGMSFPFEVWRDGDKNYLINGHQRFRTLRTMRTEGYEIPLLPVVWVECENMKEAKAKVLAGTSQFGEITDQGLYEFMNEAEFDFKSVADSFHFPEIDFDKFEANFFEDSGGEKESGHGKMKEKFIYPPFSVLNAREGEWQDKKRAWIGIGIQSELGRGGINGGGGGTWAKLDCDEYSSGKR